MKSLFKKAMPFFFVFSSVAGAASLITIEEVNKKVATLLSTFQDKPTVMALKFTDLNVDSVRALDFGLNAVIVKKGLENTLVLKLKNIGYHYGDGTAPTVTGDLSLKLDIVKAFGKNSLNKLGEEIEDTIKNIVSEYSRRYGEAANVKVVLEDLKKDAQGNFESAKVFISATVDLEKLPTPLKIEDVELKSFKVRFAANAKGVSAKVQVVLNPLYKRFNADQPGLKEIIELLLKEDVETYERISYGADALNNFATDLVNKDNSAH